MAADDVLLQAAASGQAALRFYGWSEATVSLGYFQPEHERQGERLASRPWVRRSTGGLLLVHHHELTYALALPAEPPWQGKDWRGWQTKMHAIIGAALERLGVHVDHVETTTNARGASVSCCSTPVGQIAIPPGSPSSHQIPGSDSCVTERASPSGGRPGEGLCFLVPSAGDLVIDRSKVVGSAQRRQRGALLQHGAVLLAASPFAREVRGLRELAGCDVEPGALASAIASTLAAATGWTLAPSSWSVAERGRIEELRRQRHASASWRHKR